VTRGRTVNYWFFCSSARIQNSNQNDIKALLFHCSQDSAYVPLSNKQTNKQTNKQALMMRIHLASIINIIIISIIIIVVYHLEEFEKNLDD